MLKGMKAMKMGKMGKGPRKMGVTKTVQPPLTRATPKAPTRYGQVASNVSPTRGVGSSSKPGASKVTVKRGKKY